MSAGITLSCFDNSQMTVNSEKYQTLVVKKGKWDKRYRTEPIKADDKTKPKSCVELLCVFIDGQLWLDRYVSKECICVALQINALNRIVEYAHDPWVLSYFARGFYCLPFWLS